ncbi:MAG: hypothetical protein ACPG7F_20340 [Aggregatilineales bacterium]
MRARPDGDIVLEQKILFFYEFPELMAMRDSMRANFGLSEGENG